MRAVLDANVLVGLFLEDGPRSDDARDLLDRHPLADKVLAPQTVYEAYVVLSRPRSDNGYGFRGRDVREKLRIFSSQVPILPDTSDLVDRWLDLCETHDVKGKPAHDARLAAWANAHGVTAILTLNPGDFARYGLTVLA